MIEAVDLGAILACVPREASNWRDLAAMLAFVLLARAWGSAKGRRSTREATGSAGVG